MSKYIIFKCKDCGKHSVHEVQKTSKMNPKEIKSIRLNCKYCKKSSSFGTASIVKICQNPHLACNEAKVLNIPNRGIEGFFTPICKIEKIKY